MNIGCKRLDNLSLALLCFANNMKNTLNQRQTKIIFAKVKEGYSLLCVSPLFSKDGKKITVVKKVPT